MLRVKTWFLGMGLFAVVAEAGPLGLPDRHDFGEAYMGDIVKFTLTGTNTGPRDVTIEKVRTSCGCTTVASHKGSIRPGETFTLDVKVDTNQKLGRIKKDIRLYTQPDGQVHHIKVVGTVLRHPKGHMSKAGNVFAPGCASCHANQGKYGSGRYLYFADCAMCHGINREGRSGPSLRSDRLDSLATEELARLIAAGRDTMPAFGRQHGGPLNDKQIDKIALYLKSDGKESGGNRIHDSCTDAPCRGWGVYREYCAGCHGLSKRGPTGPDISSRALARYSPAELRTLLIEGIPGSLMVPFPKSTGGTLTDKEIEDVISYLKKY